MTASRVPAEAPVTELRPGIFRLAGEKPASHAYLIRGRDKNVLVDTGTAAGFPRLREGLAQLGLEPRDVRFVVLTHEHPDHIGATGHFFAASVIGAHRLAANKIELQDEFVTMNKYFNGPTPYFHAHLWLADQAVLDLGDFRLLVLHTPGHTSGCLCLYEPSLRLLFSGDTVFAGGVLSQIEASGNISDYVASLERLCSLRIAELYPGHGRISHTPEEDLQQAIGHARILMEDSKTLFEAVTRKTGIPRLDRVLRKARPKPPAPR